jgi:hypothetical protein
MVKIVFRNGEPAGALTATPGALASGIDFTPLIRRHLEYDWGNMPAADVEQNNLYVKRRKGVMSCYTVNGVTLWIITDPGHAVTTVLLPDEY